MKTRSYAVKSDERVQRLTTVPSVRGDKYGGFRQGGMRIFWGGTYSGSSPASVLFQAGTPDCTFENIEFSDGSNAEAVGATRCAVLVNIGGRFIYCVGNDIISRGNRYPNLRPFKRRDQGCSGNWTKCRGRTFSGGDIASDGLAGDGAPAKMPVLKGCENGGGVVTFAATAGAPSATTIHVAFDREEPWATQFGVVQPIAYNVNLTVRSVVGSFTVPMPYCTNLAKNGFDINITAALPIGATNKIEVCYGIWSGGYNA